MSIEQRQQDLGLREVGPVKRVEEYKFEPIRGYPMLQWAGKRPFTSTQYYPAQHKETYGPEVEGWRNKIYWGDNLQVMSHLLKEYRGKVKLVYIDPPFDSKEDYKRKIIIRGKSAYNDINVFEEKQYSDIWTNDDFLQFMFDRLILIRELLSENGSIFVHCDWHKNHTIRCILDEIYGPYNFVNEIHRIKCNPKNSNINAFGNINDTIFFYRKKQDDSTWNTLKELKDLEDLKRLYEKVDANGRRYTTVALHAPGERKGETGSAWHGIMPPNGRHWAFVHQKLDEFDQMNLIDWSTSGNPRLIRYADEDGGNRVQNIWTMKDPQYEIYPTEKNIQITQRIIQATTDEGDLVLDCFMGSGTTQVAAMKLGRKFIGADINLGAVQTTTKRLLSVATELQSKPRVLDFEGNDNFTYYTGFEVYNVNNYDIFRNPAQAKDLLIQALEINPLQAGSLFDGEKDGCLVKIMPVNRIATRQDLNELITGLDYKAFEQRQAEHPNQPVEKITLVCMGHEPDLAAHLQHEVHPFKLDIEVVDILRDKQDLQFKRNSEASIALRDGELIIERFYPMNLLAKLSLQQEYVEDWRELVDAILIDWNYDGAILQPAVIDVPEEGKLVAGRYRIPDDAGTIRVKITDLLSESLETELVYG